MNERITFICEFNNIQKIEYYIKAMNQDLCKIPYGIKVDNRIEADTLPYHFTLSAWNITEKEKVKTELSKIEFPKIKIYIDDIEIMNGKENSYVLYFNIKKNDELKTLQEKIYKILPNEKYNPEKFNFHITIHIDKDYNKLIEMKEQLKENLIPFELEVDKFNLYEIYPAKLVQQFK